MKIKSFAAKAVSGTLGAAHLGFYIASEACVELEGKLVSKLTDRDAKEIRITRRNISGERYVGMLNSINSLRRPKRDTNVIILPAKAV